MFDLLLLYINQTCFSCESIKSIVLPAYTFAASLGESQSNEDRCRTVLYNDLMCIKDACKMDFYLLHKSLLYVLRMTQIPAIRMIFIFSKDS